MENNFKLFEDEFPPYTMEDLNKDKPEYYALVEEFYALDNEVDLLSEDIKRRYNSLHADPLNITGFIDMYGVDTYRSTVDEVRNSITERKMLLESTKEKLAALDRVTLEAYCRLKDGQFLDSANSESPVVSRLCRSGIIKGESIESLPADTLAEISKELDNDIDEAQIREFINQEEVDRVEQERRQKIFMKKREQEVRSNMIRELSESLDVSREIAKRMGLREVTNANSLNNFSFEELELVRGKRKELLMLGKDYGGIDLYNKKDVDSLMNELFRDK